MASNGTRSVSVIVCTKDGMPYVREAMASLATPDLPQLRGHRPGRGVARRNREFIETFPIYASRRRLGTRRWHWGRVQPGLRAVARGTSWGVWTPTTLLEPDRSGPSSPNPPRPPGRPPRLRCRAIGRCGRDAARTFFPARVRREAVMRCEAVPLFLRRRRFPGSGAGTSSDATRHWRHVPIRPMAAAPLGPREDPSCTDRVLGRRASVRRA